MLYEVKIGTSYEIEADTKEKAIEQADRRLADEMASNLAFNNVFEFSAKEVGD